MRLKRPSWFKPVHGLGEWIGFIGGVLVVCGIVALIAWNSVRLAGGKVTLAELTCVDPTDPCNRSAYIVRDDLGLPVVLRECGDRCGAGGSRGDPIRVLRRIDRKRCLRGERPGQRAGLVGSADRRWGAAWLFGTRRASTRARSAWRRMLEGHILEVEARPEHYLLCTRARARHRNRGPGQLRLFEPLAAP